MPYLGNEPAVAYTSTTKDSFSGDASTTDFTMSKSANVNAVRVVVENVVQDPGVAYTCSGTTLTFTSAPPTGTNNIYVVHLGPPAATVAPPSTINNPTTFTGGVTLKNETPEDTDGGRESIVTFQGTQSGNEISTLAQIQASHDGTADDQKADLIFKTNDGSDGASPTERVRIDSAGVTSVSGSLTLDNSGQSQSLVSVGGGSTNAAMSLRGSTASAYAWQISTNAYVASALEFTKSTAVGGTTFSTPSMVIDSSGHVLVGTTDAAPWGLSSGSGAAIRQEGFGAFASTAAPLELNRVGSDGNLINFRKNASTVGNIGSVNTSSASRIFISNVNTGFHLNGSTQQIIPCNGTGAKNDNAIALGNASGRFTQLFATNSSINTSDENEKQNIASLTTAEITAATAISKLFKTYKWKDAVTAKGDDARTHTGVVAQQVQSAMSDAGLDASKYAFWCSDTWWEKDVEVAAVEADEEKGVEAQDAYTRTDTYDTQEEAPEGATERTRMGVRYPELLAFISAATEQRLTSIEARLTALEAG